MSTSTFPGWWKESVLFELSGAARSGASYRELADIAMQGAGSNSPPKIRAWVKYWKDQPSDRPQARFAQLIHSYDPPLSKESSAMNMVRRVIKQHLSTCECGRPKDDPDDECCRECNMIEGVHKPREP